MVVVSWKLGSKYHTNRVLNPGPVVCESITLSTRPQLLPKLLSTAMVISRRRSLVVWLPNDHLFIVLPHWNATLVAQDMTSHPITLHRITDLSLSFFVNAVRQAGRHNCFQVSGLTQPRNYPQFTIHRPPYQSSGYKLVVFWYIGSFQCLKISGI